MNHNIENNFRSHTPSKEAVENMDYIRLKCKNMAIKIDRVRPNSREKAIALTKLEEVMFFANASLARE